MVGVLITRGITPAIPAGGLTVSLDAEGRQTLSCILHVNFDVVPTWISLALLHLKNAAEARSNRNQAQIENINIDLGIALDREFEASMQAVMAAAIAIDSFYAILKNHVKLPAELTTEWREKRTARHAQVTEVIKRAFALKPQGVRFLRQNLKELYKMRDQAVHPSSKFEAPVLHPELNVGVEWRFVYFCATNAELAVNAMTGIFWDLAHSRNPANSRVIEYMDSLRLRLQELMPKGHPTKPVAENNQ